MTFGYWFWLGMACLGGALLLLFLTRPGHKPRTTRTVHAVALFLLLAFGGFKCARDEHVRTDLLTHAPAVYTIAKIRDDGGGMKFHEDKRRVEAVEYRYRIAGRDYMSLGNLAHGYTIERDFLPDDLRGKCVLVQLPASRHDISRLEALLSTCPPAPEGGWDGLPDALRNDIDTLWWRGGK